MTRRAGRPSNWIHSKDSFFKYVSPTTALAILNSGKLRWSSPEKFNDPFDMRFEMQSRNDLAKIRQLALDALWNAHYGPEPTTAGNELAFVISSLRSRFPKMTRADFEREFGEAIDESLSMIPRHVSELNEILGSAMLDTKILCLSERPDNLVMWSHYADCHSGAVLEFACVPEVDSAWGAAMPVRYLEKIPETFSDELVVALCSGQRGLDPGEFIDKVVTTKAKAWEYEQEWRVALHFTNPDEPTLDLAFGRRELVAIYLGCRMSSITCREIATRVGESYSETRLLQAQKSNREFALEFCEYR